MSLPRDIRRLALLAIYQLDSGSISSDDAPAAALGALGDLESLESEGLPKPTGKLTDRDRQRAAKLAASAWNDRKTADALVLELAPDWPTGRQPIVDRSILRIAIFEMTTGATPPKAAVNEAVELAKQFSTEKSPSFINGILGKILKTVLARQDAAAAQIPAPDPAADPATDPAEEHAGNGDESDA
ncbi:MAG: transcription antitermination factor NusB [Planctomycetota bacterium]